jgi:hypothetical protein
MIGDTASPYLVSYIYAREFLDQQYGIRKFGDYYMVGDSNVCIDDARVIYVKNRHRLPLGTADAKKSGSRNRRYRRLQKLKEDSFIDERSLGTL